MNSPHTDELLSAYIDGLAAPDDIARIESDPALLERANELRAAAQAVGQQVPPPPAGAVDAAVTAALQQSSTAANVTAISARPKTRNRQVFGIAAAAAVVAIAFIAGAVLLNAGDDSGSENDLAASLESSEDSATLSDSDQDATGSSPTSTAAAEAAEVPQADEEAAQEETIEEAAGEVALEQAPSEAAAADTDEGADSAADDAAADDAAAEEESASEFAAEPDTEIPEFSDAAAVIAAIEADLLTPEETTQLLPCALEMPADRPNSTSVAYRALVPEGAVLVTGWQTADGFEMDEFIQIDTCTTVQATGP